MSGSPARRQRKRCGSTSITVLIFMGTGETMPRPSKAHAREIKDIPYDRVNRGTGKRYQSQVYTCRKDEAGKKLDKAAMLICSKALGHNRISVVADNYIRGL